MKIAKIAFVAELSKLYDSECRALSLLPALAERLNSAQLKRILNRYIDGSRLTIGKMEILFHLMNSNIMAAEDRVFAPVLRTSTITNLRLSHDVNDIFIAGRIQQLLHLKIACCETLISISERMQTNAATSILKEICDYESGVLKDLGIYTIPSRNGHHYAVVRK